MDFTLPLNGLAQGRTVFDWKAGKEFFEAFDNAEILSSALDVHVTVEKSGRYIGIDLEIEGNVTVPCDRCLEDLVLPVSVSPRFSVKFGEEPREQAEDSKEGEREILYLPASDADLDLSQIVYDFVSISLPLQRVHPEGECNPEMTRYLGDGGSSAREPEGENPFAALKGLFDGK